MSEETIRVKEIPRDVEFNALFEIATNDVNYFTHGFFKYPCKFIPQIPRWAILKYTKSGEYILDPFAGSGTTLVEAILHRRNALGVDFDSLSQLLCKTKTVNLSFGQLQCLKEICDKLSSDNETEISYYPNLNNVTHWFSKKNIEQLGKIRQFIEKISSQAKDEAIYNFLLVCFASIIKKCSYCDDVSPKPYVSRRIIKNPLNACDIFANTLKINIKKIERFAELDLGKSSIIAQDARSIIAPEYYNKVSLAVTSPPYINAFDYVRSLRLENAWLDYYGDSNIIEIKKKQIGNELIPSKVYSNFLPYSNIMKLDEVLLRIYKVDKRRAYVVFNFFDDMKKCLKEVWKLLKTNSHFIIIIGNSSIRGIEIPTNEILVELARECNYVMHNMFSYIIKNRYIRIPRSGRGGLIKRDWVIDLVKTNE